jgi:hypothetical protein
VAEGRAWRNSDWATEPTATGHEAHSAAVFVVKEGEPAANADPVEARDLLRGGVVRERVPSRLGCLPRLPKSKVAGVHAQRLLTMNQCFNLCDAFPALFKVIDETQTGELESVPTPQLAVVNDGETGPLWLRSD